MRIKDAVVGGSLLLVTACNAEQQPAPISTAPVPETSSSLPAPDCPAYIGSVALVDRTAKTFRIEQLKSTEGLCPGSDVQPRVPVFEEGEEYLTEGTAIVGTLALGDTFEAVCLTVTFPQAVGVSKDGMEGVATFGYPVNEQIVNAVGPLRSCRVM